MCGDVSPETMEGGGVVGGIEKCHFSFLTICLFEVSRIFPVRRQTWVGEAAVCLLNLELEPSPY